MTQKRKLENESNSQSKRRRIDDGDFIIRRKKNSIYDSDDDFEMKDVEEEVDVSFEEYSNGSTSTNPKPNVNKDKPAKKTEKKKEKKEKNVKQEKTEKKTKKEKKEKKEKTEKKSKNKQAKKDKKDKDIKPKKEKKSKKEEDELPVFEWWNLPKEDFEKLVNRGRTDDKWDELVHNGPLLAPEYEPHEIKPIYKGNKIDLNAEEEEVLTMFAVLKGSENYDNPTFRMNFWKSFLKILRKNHPLRNAKLEEIDMDVIYRWHVDKKAKEKAISSEEKKRLKEEKEKLEEKYMYCMIDGRKELVGNFRVEPPSLFRGRGDHPLTGTLKPRIQPEDITINIGNINDAPPPPPGRKWGEVIVNKKVQWLAMWKDFTGSVKYIQLSRKASFKGISDYRKYEKARELKGKLIEDIRDEYQNNWKSNDLFLRQRGVAMYFIDRLALRCGNDKDTSKKADTVGCCSLKIENIELKDDNVIELDFLGKDSIRYQNSVEVPKLVYKNLKDFIKGKDKKEKIFDKLSSSELNNFLKEKLSGLTAKVFRTYNASFTLDIELKKNSHTILSKSVEEKVQYFNDANRTVAILCNHQKAVSKNFGEQIQRVDADLEDNEEYLRALKKAYKNWDTKKEEIQKNWEKKLEKKTKEYEKALNEYEKETERLTKEAERAKLSLAVYLATNGLILPKKPKKLTLKKLPNSKDALKKKIEKQKEIIAKKKIQKQEKEDNKTVSLTTSKTNYCDPRIGISFCKRHDVPVKKIFNATMLASFPWAVGVDSNFIF